AYAWIVERRPPARALRRVAPLLAVLLVWVVLHPTITNRLTGRYVDTLEIKNRPGLLETGRRTLLSLVNLDRLADPEAAWTPALPRGAAGPLLLFALTAWAVFGRGGKRRTSAPRESIDRTAATIRFGATWAALGFAPLFLPSINWHAYYGVIGVLGAW